MVNGMCNQNLISFKGMAHKHFALDFHYEPIKYLLAISNIYSIEVESIEQKQPPGISW